jgi:two-component system phosphate regulon response regulator PhoB
VKTILIVDDELSILKMLSDYLKSKYQIVTAINGQTALKFIKEKKPDLMIVDWMLPDIEGPEIVTRVRNFSDSKDIPILMLTAKGEESDKIKGFSSGVDDFLVKPFLLSELDPRINSLMRRSGMGNTDQISLGELFLDDDNHEFQIHNKPVKLTKNEFRLMKLLIKKPGKTFSREEIVNKVWETNMEISDRAVDVAIFRLRKLLVDNNSDRLETIRGVGYRLNK